MAYPTTTYAPAPPTSAPAGKIKPSAAWYWIGAILIFLGIAGAAGLITTGLVSTSRTVDRFGRFVWNGVPQPLTFEKGGTYTVYYEHDSKVDGVRYQTPEGLKNSINMSFTPAGGGQPILLRPSNDTASFSFSGRVGQSIGKVTIPEGGTYIAEVQVTGYDGPIVIAIGKGVLGKLIGFVLGGLAIGAVGFVSGLVILIVTGVKRGKRKRQRRAAEVAAASTAAYAPSNASLTAAPPPGGFGAPAPSPPGFGAPSPAPSPPGFGAPAPAPSPAPAPGEQPGGPPPSSWPPPPQDAPSPPASSDAEERGGWSPPPPP
jgi:hypothetical protein